MTDRSERGRALLTALRRLAAAAALAAAYLMLAQYWVGHARAAEAAHAASPIAAP